MIKTVVRQYHWSPDIIGDLFIDDQDYKGLEFWHADAIEINSEMKKTTPNV